MDKIPNGYYMKARIIVEKPISKAPPHIREIWDYFLREANHRGNKYGKHEIKRGQLFRSFKEIKDDLCWFAGWRKMTYNENHMKTAMKYLKKHLMITSTKHPAGMLITVVNYSFYQNAKNYETTSEATKETTSESTDEKPEGSHNNKNVKNEKNVNNNYPEQIKEIVSFLNSTCKTKYRAETKKTKTLIETRLSEKYTLDDFKTVILKKYNQWANTEDEMYLRPETLFGNKFEGYLNQKIIKKDKTETVKNPNVWHGVDSKQSAQG